MIDNPILEMMAKQRHTCKCEKCRKTMSFTLEDDVALNLWENTVQIECPQCGARYKVSLDLELIDKE